MVQTDREAYFDEILRRSEQFGFEVLVPTSTEYGGFTYTWMCIDRTMGGWAIHPYRIGCSGPADYPILWLHEELDDQPEFGKTGIGILVRGLISTPVDLPQLERWAQKEFAVDGLKVEFWDVPVADLHVKVPRVAKVLVPVLEAAARTFNKEPSWDALDATLDDLIAGSGATVTLVRRCGHRVPTARSADGLQAMCANLATRLGDGDYAQEFTVIAGDLAIVARRGLDALWTVAQKESSIPVKGHAFPGMAWIRTGPGIPWNAVDANGFGIFAGPPTRQQNEILTSFYATHCKYKVGALGSDMLAPLYEILAAVSGHGRSKKAKGLYIPTGLFYSLSSALATNGNLIVWYVP